MIKTILSILGAILSAILSAYVSLALRQQKRVQDSQGATDKELSEMHHQIEALNRRLLDAWDDIDQRFVQVVRRRREELDGRADDLGV